MNIPDEDLAILNAAAPYINASLFEASDLVEIYQRELARSSDIDIEVEKVKVLSQIFLHFILGETVFTDSVTILLILTVLIGQLQRSAKKLYVVARHFFLLLLNCSAWPCLGPA